MTRRISFQVLSLALGLIVALSVVGVAMAALRGDEPAAVISPAACGAPGPWTVASPIPTPVFGDMVAGDGTYAYAAGGYSFQLPGPTNQFARYDPVANTWSALASLPAADYNGAAVYASGKVYLFGGTNGSTVSATTSIYDVAANSWSTGAPLPAPREQMGAGYAGGKIYIAGGSDSQSINPQSTLFSYDVTSGTWTTLAPMPQALAGPGSGVVNGHLYIAGGRDDSSPNRTTVYDYNISTNSWTTVAPLPVGVNVPGSAVLGGELVVFGGGNPFSDPLHMSVPIGQAPLTTGTTQIYDPVSNTWTSGPSLNTARSFVGGTAAGNYLVAVGGYDGSTSLSSVEVSLVPCGTPTPTPTAGTATSTPSATATSTGTPTRTSTHLHAYDHSYLHRNRYVYAHAYCHRYRNCHLHRYPHLGRAYLELLPVPPPYCHPLHLLHSHQRPRGRPQTRLQPSRLHIHLPTHLPLPPTNLPTNTPTDTNTPLPTQTPGGPSATTVPTDTSTPSRPIHLRHFHLPLRPALPPQLTLQPRLLCLPQQHAHSPTQMCLWAARSIPTSTALLAWALSTVTPMAPSGPITM